MDDGPKKELEGLQAYLTEIKRGVGFAPSIDWGSLKDAEIENETTVEYPILAQIIQKVLTSLNKLQEASQIGGVLLPAILLDENRRQLEKAIWVLTSERGYTSIGVNTANWNFDARALTHGPQKSYGTASIEGGTGEDPGRPEIALQFATEKRALVQKVTIKASQRSPLDDGVQKDMFLVRTEMCMASGGSISTQMGMRKSEVTVASYLLAYSAALDGGATIEVGASTWRDPNGAHSSVEICYGGQEGVTITWTSELRAWHVSNNEE